MRSYGSSYLSLNYNRHDSVCYSDFGRDASISVMYLDMQSWSLNACIRIEIVIII